MLQSCVFNNVNIVTSYCSLKQLNAHLDYHLQCKFSEAVFLLNTQFVLDYCDMYANEKNSLENGIQHMRSNIENGFKLMQQVHGKRLPDDVSKLITSFLY